MTESETETETETAVTHGSSRRRRHHYACRRTTEAVTHGPTTFQSSWPAPAAAVDPGYRTRWDHTVSEDPRQNWQILRPTQPAGVGP